MTQSAPPLTPEQDNALRNTRREARGCLECLVATVAKCNAITPHTGTNQTLKLGLIVESAGALHSLIAAFMQKEGPQIKPSPEVRLYAALFIHFSSIHTESPHKAALETLTKLGHTITAQLIPWNED